MGATIADVQSVAGAGATSYALPAFAVNPVGGDTIVVGIQYFFDPGTPLAPTDTKGNTYVQTGTKQVPGGNGASMVLWRAENVAGGATTVTINQTAGLFPTAVAWLLTGMRAASYNGDFFGTTGSTTPAVLGATTAAPAANSIFLSMLGYASSSGVTVPTGYNTIGSNGYTAGMDANAARNNAGAASKLFTGYKVASAAETPSWANGGGVFWGGVTASFAPSPPVDLGSLWFPPTFPDKVPHRRTWPHWQHTGPVLPPDPPVAMGIFPGQVAHTPQFRPLGGEVRPSTVATIPIPDLLAGLTFAAVFPNTVPHRRLPTAAMPTLFVPPFYIVTAGIPWQPRFPDLVPHRRLSAAAMPSIFEPSHAPDILVGASLAWQSRYPDRVPHRRTPLLGGPSFVPAPSTLVSGAGICVSLVDLAVTQSTLVHVEVTQPTILDGGVTASTLAQVEIC